MRLTHAKVVSFTKKVCVRSSEYVFEGSFSHLYIV